MMEIYGNVNAGRLTQLARLGPINPLVKKKQVVYKWYLIENVLEGGSLSLSHSLTHTHTSKQLQGGGWQRKQEEEEEGGENRKCEKGV